MLASIAKKELPVLFIKEFSLSYTSEKVKIKLHEVCDFL